VGARKVSQVCRIGLRHFPTYSSLTFTEHALAIGGLHGAKLEVASGPSACQRLTSVINCTDGCNHSRTSGKSDGKSHCEHGGARIQVTGAARGDGAALRRSNYWALRWKWRKCPTARGSFTTIPWIALCLVGAYRFAFGKAATNSSHFVTSMTAPVASGWSESPGGSRSNALRWMAGRLPTGSGRRRLTV
jgi:hypothetical protein